MKYIWKYFSDLNRKRTGTGYGPLPLQYSEILAYFNLYKIIYEPIEIEIISILDDVAMGVYVEQIKEDTARQNSKIKKK